MMPPLVEILGTNNILLISPPEDYNFFLKILRFYCFSLFKEKPYNAW